MLENRITVDEERIKQLEKELEMTIVFGEQADRKYEEVSSENYQGRRQQSEPPPRQGLGHP